MTKINIYESGIISVRSENWSTTEIDQSKEQQKLNWLEDQRNRNVARETRITDEFVTFYGDYGVAI